MGVAAALQSPDLDAALELYKGQLLEGFELTNAEGFEAWLTAQRERLHRLYIHALQSEAELLKNAGETRDALTLYQRLLQADPAHEVALREAMRLHALLGERGTAINLFEQFREHLRTTVKLEPLFETTDLAERIRQGLVPQETAEPQASAQAPFVGRSDALTRIAQTRALLTLIVGEPGLGKTRLAQTATRDTAVLWLRFPETASRTPLSAVADVLRERRSVAQLQSLGRAVWQEVLRLVPELSPNEMVDGTQKLEGRVRFLEGLAQTLIALAGTNGVIMLDDLHWADATSLEVIHHITKRLKREPSARLMATSWRQELSERTELRALIGQLEREHQIERIDLEPLELQEVSQLARLSGVKHIPESLYQDTNGNPYFVLETLHAVLETGESLEAEIPVSPSLQDAVMRRVDRLGVGVRRLLEAASLMGNGFQLQDITPASSLGEWEALEGATQAGLITPLEAGLGYVFSHDLTRRSLEAQLSPARQHLIHTTLAQRLESLGTQPARIAHHFEWAGQRSKALPWRLKAAQAALRVYANHEALALYGAALEDGADLETSFEIHLARAKILTILGQTQARETTISILEGVANQLGNEKQKADVTLLRITF